MSFVKLAIACKRCPVHTVNFFQENAGAIQVGTISQPIIVLEMQVSLGLHSDVVTTCYFICVHWFQISMEFSYPFSDVRLPYQISHRSNESSSSVFQLPKSVSPGKNAVWSLTKSNRVNQDAQRQEGMRLLAQKFRKCLIFGSIQLRAFFNANTHISWDDNE